MKEAPHNPVMQDVSKDKVTGCYKLRHYVKPPKFNYGFLPQTYCPVEAGGDGDGMDLVDIGQKNQKPLLAVSDYFILGIVGLMDQGELDAKVLAIELNEANELGIHNLEEYKRLYPGAVAEIMDWFENYKVWEGKKKNHFIWGG